MAQTTNQFAQTPEVGDIDLAYQGQVMTAMIGTSVVGSLVAGQFVKMVDVAGGVPKVQPLAANTDATFGVLVRNLKDATFVANSRVEVAGRNAVIYVTAGAAIARGAKLEVVAATSKVITNAGTNPVVGIALDKAAGDNSVIRVLLNAPL